MMRDEYLRSAESNESQGNKNENVGRGSHTLFGLQNSDNLIGPNGGQLSAIAAPGNVRHCVWGRYLDVPWAECREVWCLTETDDQAVGKRVRACGVLDAHGLLGQHMWYAVAEKVAVVVAEPRRPLCRSSPYVGHS